MAKTTLKIVERKTTVPRERFRKAFEEVRTDSFKNLDPEVPANSAKKTTNTQKKSR